MSLVTDIVLKRFAILYGEPKTSDPEAFTAEYETALKGYGAAALEEATSRVVKANEYRSWPMPGEVCKACKDIASERAAAAKRVYEPVPELPAPDAASAARVKALAAKFATQHAAIEADRKRWRPDTSRDAMEKL